MIEMDTSRSYLNALKGMGMLFVFLGHATDIERDVYDFFYSFHMPLFFFIGGALAHPANYSRDFLSVLTEKAGRLLVPFLAFGLLSMALYLLLYEVSFNQFVVKLMGTFSGVPARLYNFNSSPLWFLLALFWCQLLFWGYINSDKSKALVLVPVAIGLVIALTIPNIYPFAFHSACLGFLFFIIGHHCRAIVTWISAANKWTMFYLGGLLFTCVALGATKLNIATAEVEGVLTFPFIALAGITACCMWCRLEIIVRVFETPGRYSLFLMGINYWIILLPLPWAASPVISTIIYFISATILAMVLCRIRIIDQLFNSGVKFKSIIFQK